MVVEKYLRCSCVFKGKRAQERNGITAHMHIAVWVNNYTVISKESFWHLQRSNFFDPRTAPSKESFWPRLGLHLQGVVPILHKGPFQLLRESFKNDTSKRVTVTQLFKGVILTLTMCQFYCFWSHFYFFLELFLLLFGFISTPRVWSTFLLGLTLTPMTCHPTLIEGHFYSW